MKAPAILTPLEGKPKRHKDFLTLDLECKDGMTQKGGFTRPFMAGVYDGEEFFCFRDKYPAEDEDSCWAPGGCIDKALCHILSKKYRGRIIYAHNGGKFDFLFLMAWLQSEGWGWEIVPIASGILQLKVWAPGTPKKKRRNGKCWRFIDSLKLIPTSLRKAAETFGVTLKGELDYDTHESDSRWDEYNRIDCVALHETLGRFFEYVEDDLGGEVGITLPATAMRLYRRQYQQNPIERNQETHRFIRESYCGGRVEVFEERGERLHYFDINSSYATAMLEPVPVGPARHWRGPPLERFTCGKHVGFVRCDVRVPDDMHIPPLPLRWKHKLIFPVGRFSGVWEWSELSRAIALGVLIERYYESVWYRAEPALAKYADTMYTERFRGNDAGRKYTCKMFLTNLYGKFGQNPARESFASHLDLDDHFEWCDDAERVARIKKVSDAAYIIPQIAARITARARVYLHQVMCEAIQRGGRVYYCDTDSVITDVPLDTSSELGGLKDEYPAYSGHIRGRFLAPKMYYLEAWEQYCMLEDLSLAKAKGLQKEDKTVLALKRLESGETLTQRRLQKVGALAKSGFQTGPRMLEVPRTWRGYDASKRIHTGDGGTRPIRLPIR